MRKLTVILLVFAFAGTASAAWSDLIGADGDWLDPLMWNNGVPTYPGGLAPALGTGGTHVIHINAGEVIDAQGMLGPAWNGDNTLNVAGTLNMMTIAPMGGAYSMTFAHEANTVGTLNITGDGVVTDIIGIRLSRRGVGTINVSDNGLLETALLDWEPTDGGTSAINVTGDGQIIIAGDVLDDMIAAFDAGVLNTDVINLVGGDTVVGIPEPATMLMFGLGGLALIRRKRN